MSWQSESQKWLHGRVNDADMNDVVNWLTSDPLWLKHAKFKFTPGNGSHFATVYIPQIGQVLATWKGDVLTLSSTGGKQVKKWIVAELVKPYHQLETLE